MEDYLRSKVFQETPKSEAIQDGRHLFMPLLIQ